MTDITILLADNDEDFLATYGEFLESSGYRVLTAASPDAAKKVLETRRVHLAILDLRMVNDNDEKDRSGLLLAKNVARTVPKLILTRFPTYQDVVDALRLDVHDLPPAIDFLDKREDLSKLLSAIQRVIDEHLPINWDLLIQFQRQPILSFVQLVEWIDPDLDDTYLGERKAELEDLFRKLFRQHAQITFSRLLTYGRQYVILSLYAYNSEGQETPYIVSIGQNELIREERRVYQTAVSQHMGHTNLTYELSENTLHYAANAYRLVDTFSEEPLALKNQFHCHPIAKSIDVIDHLYRTNLSAWNKKGQTSLNRATSVHDFYTAWLQDEGLAVSEQQMQQKVKAICEKSAGAEWGQFTYSSQTLTYHQAAGGEAVRFPNPITCLYDKRLGGHSFVRWGTIHGRVNLETVLADRNGRSWLIDFTQIGNGPVLHDFVTLETAVKQHLTSAAPLSDLYLLEQKLAGLTNLSDELDDSSLPDILQPIASMTVHLRQLAAKLIGCSLDAYFTGLYFQAIRHLAAYQPDIYNPRHALRSYLHALLLAAIHCEKLDNPLPQQKDLPEQAAQTLWIDKTNKAVFVEGVLIDLTIQDFQILTYLYENANQLCERKAIIVKGLGDVYDEFDPEESRLNSAMSRLRQKIEPNPENPKYLLTIRGRGYKLMI